MSHQMASETTDTMISAANAFMAGEQWLNAGFAYAKAADSYLQANDAQNAAINFTNAAIAYEKVSIPHAIAVLKRASEIYVGAQCPVLAVPVERKIASFYENEGGLGNVEKAILHYQKAADCCDAGGLKASRDTNLQAIAHLCGITGLDLKACRLLEQVAESACLDILRLYSVRPVLLKAALCRLATGDSIALADALIRYSAISDEWSSSVEARLLFQLALALQARDIDTFDNITSELQSALGSLDTWQRIVINRAKNAITLPHVK